MIETIERMLTDLEHAKLTRPRFAFSLASVAAATFAAPAAIAAQEKPTGSVGLSAASQQIGLDAIAEWYGSLPDDYFYSLKGLPPLLILHGAQDTNIPVINAQQLIRVCQIERFNCLNHIYADQGHGVMGKALEDADDRTLESLAGAMRESSTKGDH